MHLLLPLALALQSVAADASAASDAPARQRPTTDTTFRPVLQSLVAGAVDTALAVEAAPAAPGAPSLQRLRDLVAGRARQKADAPAAVEPPLGPCPQYALRIIRPDTSVHHTLRIVHPVHASPMPVANPCALGLRRVSSPPPPTGSLPTLRVTPDGARPR